MEARISNKELAPLCRRLSTGIAAGVGIRRIVERETSGHGSSALRRRMIQVGDVIDRGGSLVEGFERTGKYFPPLFLELTQVGEQTGNLAEVFQQLADNYEHRIKLRRLFISSIAWPVIQLLAAIGVIGLLILVMGYLKDSTGGPIDILGLGLSGISGLAVYLAVVGLFFLALLAVYQAMRRGMLWTRPLQKLIMRVPVIGKFIQTMALERLAWTLYMTLNTSLDLRKSLELCLRSTHNAQFTDHTDEIVADAVGGRSLYEAFNNTGAFPGDFLDALQVGEDSGRLPESMQHLAGEYRDSVKRMMATLTVAGGFLVFLLVILAILAVIFMIASQTIFPYYRMIDELSH